MSVKFTGEKKSQWKPNHTQLTVAKCQQAKSRGAFVQRRVLRTKRVKKRREKKANPSAKTTSLFLSKLKVAWQLEEGYFCNWTPGVRGNAVLVTEKERPKGRL